MPEIFALCAILLVIGMVLVRAAMLRRQGIQAILFGQTHRSDFILLPFVLCYVYHLFAGVFGWPSLGTHFFWDLPAIRWFGAVLCLLGTAVFLWGLVSFGRSFRVGIDPQKPDQLITTGAFAKSRNPLYLAFLLELTGFFLLYPDWLFAAYLLAGALVIHRQIRREEAFLRKHYGAEFETYCRRTRRYL